MQHKQLFLSAVAIAAALACQYSDAAELEKTKDLGEKIEAVAELYGLSPDLFNAVLAVESRHDQAAVNHRTKDYGIGQINAKTAKLYGLDLQRLKHDVNYNLAASAKILSDFQRRYSRREPVVWFCHYNTGTRPSSGKSKACFSYVRKVQRALALQDGGGL